VNFPQTFVNNIRVSFGAEGERWLADLPHLLDQAAQKWQLTLGEPFLLSYNYVCAATRADGSDVVLKLGVPNRELHSELAALRLFNGNGAVRLLAADEEKSMFLLERLRPGRMLVDLQDDERATHIAAEVMRRLWRAAPADADAAGFIQLSAWFGELSKLRPRFRGGTGPFPKELVERVESLLPELFDDAAPPILMHGDFHHYNILSSGESWVIIDPKGVIGPRGYECGPFLVNPWGDFSQHPDADKITMRRIAILSEYLGLEREQILHWGICHSLLSAWWDLADDNTGGEYSMGCGELFMGLQV